MQNLYERLKEYGGQDYYAFHMPGHKRNKTVAEGLPYQIDITEIDGFDDLHHADGILKQAQERAAGLYHAEESHFLVNGSTVGILSAILGCTRRGDKILVSRNCHKSVYHAVYMNELSPVYIYPEFLASSHINGEVRKEDIEAALEKDSDVRAVVIVSPTYDGVVSDVRGIAEIVHKKGIPLIVDEAHGAHFGFGEAFPENANQCGADVVIHSLHKTLPSMTQTAMLHINGGLVNRSRVRKYLHMLQSSSPSYVLMASIDKCMDFLEKSGQEAFPIYEERLLKLREELRRLKNLQMIETEHFDISKIIISTLGCKISSRELYEILLEKYHLQMEMKAESYIVAMTSVCDTEEGFERLGKALAEIDEIAGKCDADRNSCGESRKGIDGSRKNEVIYSELPHPEYYCSSAVIEEFPEEEFEVRTWETCDGMISAEYAYLYPPGIPLLVPGEKVDEDIIKCLCHYREMGFEVEGAENEGMLKVLPVSEIQHYIKE